MHHFATGKYGSVRLDAPRRRGAVAIWMALSLVTFLSIMALLIDLGYRYFKRTEAQKAADTAALAGAIHIQEGEAEANKWATYYAALNGYDSRDSRVTVKGKIAPDGHSSHYGVSVSKTEPLFFASLFNPKKRDVGAMAIAEYLSLAPIDINGGGPYGARGPINLSVFGPDGYYNNGDAYSATRSADGSPNELYNRNGYDFALDVPSGYSAKFGTSQVVVEIFDPDCYNAGGNPDADGINTVDEYRRPDGAIGTSGDVTTTLYRLYWDKGTPSDISDDELIAQQSYGSDSSTDRKWVSPSGFSFDRSRYQKGKFRLNVKSTSGSSENGFTLRAGPPHAADMTELEWVENYGKEAETAAITATGNLPMNFNTNGTVTVTLGYVAAEARGGKIYINKFDTDVGATHIIYSCDTLSQTWTGTLAGNGTWTMDTIDVPAGYAGGKWKATYQAGVQDTSVWTMYFSNVVPGQPGKLRLIR